MANLFDNLFKDNVIHCVSSGNTFGKHVRNHKNTFFDIMKNRKIITCKTAVICYVSFNYDN